MRLKIWCDGESWKILDFWVEVKKALANPREQALQDVRRWRENSATCPCKCQPSSAVPSSGRSGISGEPQNPLPENYRTEPQATSEEQPWDHASCWPFSINQTNRPKKKNSHIPLAHHIVSARSVPRHRSFLIPAASERHAATALTCRCSPGEEHGLWMWSRRPVSHAAIPPRPPCLDGGAGLRVASRMGTTTFVFVRRICTVGVPRMAEWVHRTPTGNSCIQKGQ